MIKLAYHSCKLNVDYSLRRQLLCIILLLCVSEKLSELAVAAGFEVIVSSYVQKETVNHKENICAPRIFIQAKLRKPSVSTASQSSDS